MKQILKIIAYCSVLLIFSICACAQMTKVIDYSTFNSSQCNTFSPSATVSGLQHFSTCGQPLFSNSPKYLRLSASNSNLDLKGTEFRIVNEFKQGYSYKITVNAVSKTPSPSSDPRCKLRIDFTSVAAASGSFCNGVQPISGTVQTGFTPNNIDILPLNYIDHIFTFNSLQNAATSVFICANFYKLNSTSSSWVDIKKITIEEIAPPITFSITPSTLAVPCASTSQQSFVVNNINNTPGTILYNWNLGSSNNGWLYLGNPAPQTFQTSTNQIALTPASASTSLSNVSVGVNINGVNNTTLTSTVSRSSGVINNSSLPMSGSDLVCGSSETYSVTGVPATASVSWAIGGIQTNGSYLPLQEVCTLSPNGTQATLTKINNGTVKLIATITHCDGVKQVSIKEVTFGVPELYGNAGYYTDNIGLTQPVEGTVTYMSSPSFYITLESSGVNSYVWQPASSNNANYYLGGLGNSFATCWWSTPLVRNDFFGFTVVTTNGCGTRSDPLYFYYDGPSQYYRVAPNPVKSSLNLTQVDFKRNPVPKGGKPINANLSKIQIMDKMGRIVLEKSFASGTKVTTIDVNSLKSDIYTVRIFSQDENVESHQIVIQH